MVVMNGLAITAGSRPIRLAKIGRIHPTSLATTITSKMVKLTVNATVGVIESIPRSHLSIKNSLAKVTIAKTPPQKIETLSSLKIILQVFQFSRPKQLLRYYRGR